ncbi:MAG: hypothetical protein ACPGQS_13605 [Bradymonadia bacterium]
MKQKKNVLHKLSSGSDLFWTLRGVLSSGRDIQCAPEDGIFEPTHEERKKTGEGSRKKEEVLTAKRVHMRYGVGGQLMQIYRQTVGVEFQAHA